MVSIEIDGKKIEAQDGAMVIEAADEAGIYIPRFCYHKHLSVAANCRMCLVEVEKARKPLPACATPVTDGMRIFTQSPAALAAQKGVMEFLLINHPLDCPICDQGGECELQDIAMGYGQDVSRYSEAKRVVADKDIGPLISTDMTRCIHCTRCVRFGEEIAGIKELGATGRGEHMRIGTYVASTVDSELSGNVIDLCPVGALTSKPFRFSARAWELVQRDSIAAHDCVGSNLHVHVKGREVMRVVPKENDEVNETWLSDRDRFSYEGIKSSERLTAPQIKQNGQWKTVDWETALRTAAEGLQGIFGQQGGEKLGFLASPNATVEELYLLQKLARSLGCNNIDHRLRQVDFSAQDDDPVFPYLGQSLQDLEHNGYSLLIGGNLRKDQPLIGHRLRKSVLNGGKLALINSLRSQAYCELDQELTGSADAVLRHVAGVAKALLAKAAGKAPEGLAGLLKDIEVEAAHESIAQGLLAADKATVLLGMQAGFQPNYAILRALAQAIASMSDARLGYLSAGANAAGAALAGVLPHRVVGGTANGATGMNAAQMLTQACKGMLLLNLEPELDSSVGAQAVTTLQQVECVVALTPYRTAQMETYADVMLPIGVFTETAGTFINVEGRWQSFQGVTPPPGEARPAWKVMRVLANLMNLDGFDYFSVQEIHDEARTRIGEVEANTLQAVKLPDQLPAAAGGLQRINDLPIYAVDNIVRRAGALQKTHDALLAAAYVCEEQAKALELQAGEWVQLTQDGHSLSLPLCIDQRVPQGCVYVPQGVAGSEALGFAAGAVTLTKAHKNSEEQEAVSVSHA